MAKEHGNTAERELLKIIEGKSEIKKFVKKENDFAIGSFFKGLFSSISGKFHKGSGDRETAITPKKVNVSLILVIGILFLSYATIFVRGVEQLQRLPRFEIPPVQAKARGIVLPLKEYAFYIEKILGRNIFDATLSAQKPMVEKGAGGKINDLIKDLRLTGISWSDNREERFVMIEDMQAKVTYFLKEGETISKSNISIKKISRDKVALFYMDEETELR
jgi:hypothetical protein